jgi:hypothetical protein
MNVAKLQAGSFGPLKFVVVMALAVGGCGDPKAAPTGDRSAAGDGIGAGADNGGASESSASVASSGENEPVQTASAASSADRDSAATPVADRADPMPAVEEDPYEADQRRRRQAEDMIYATIRIKMEEMIERRSDLLKEGRDPTDVEIRQLEGSIMKARNLLMEAGEIVEDLQPPIVLTAPRQ